MLGTVRKPSPLRKQGAWRSFVRELHVHRAFYWMMLPGLLYILIVYYLPMVGTLIAFEDYNPIKGIFGSTWVGFKNFKFLFTSGNALSITLNTIGYNLVFLITGLGGAMGFAILINEAGSKRLSSVYKTLMLLPYFLSWIVCEYLLFAFLSMDKGIINKWLAATGGKPIFWYGDPKYWYPLLPLAFLWKNIGYQSVIFVAGITGISPDYYEAAQIDGATKWQQTISITVPMLMPIVIILALLQLGKVFSGAFGDWGIFLNLPQNSGILYPATNVIDTYVYNALRKLGDYGMSGAAGLYQSVVGFVLVLATNFVIRKYDRDSALF